MDMLREREREKEDVRRGYGESRGFDRGYYTREDESREDAFMRSYRSRDLGSDYLADSYARTDVRRDRQEDEFASDRRAYGAEPYDFGAPGRDLRHEGYGYYYYDREDDRRADMRDDRGYAEFTPVEFSAPAVKKKRNINGGSKLLIAVYFALVALIASLVITNVVMFGEKTVEAETPVNEYSSELMSTAVLEDGTTESIATETLEGYEYDTTTNWFDGFCDWLSGGAR